jgi:hypothetical protein
MNEVRILVLQRGWVVVGDYTEEGDECVLRNASVIRRWGTSKGLGEIVNGPTENTVLDACGEVRAHKLAVVMHIKADAEGWRRA